MVGDKTTKEDPADVAQLVGHPPLHQKVSGSIPGQGTLTSMFLSLSSSPSKNHF